MRAFNGSGIAIVPVTAWLCAGAAMVSAAQAQTTWGVCSNTGATLCSPVGTPVGIGTTTPSGGTSLYIMGANYQYFAALEVDTPAINEQSSMALFSAGAPKWQIGKNTDDSFFLWDFAGSRVPFSVASNGNMGLMASGGNVGVGTAAPSKTLEVNGTFSAIPAMVGNAYTANNTWINAYFSGNVFWNGTQWVNNTWAGNNGWGALAFNGTGGDLGYFSDTGTGTTNRTYTEAQFLSKGKFFISGTTGNVGIGVTSSPTTKLAVNGRVAATEVLVTNSPGADYVFAPEYRLAPLSEVAEYVKANRHLPEIPSAAEAAEKGVNLGDMQAKLLAKIEELTLHMIAAEKENRELRDRLGRLEAREAVENKDK